MNESSEGAVAQSAGVTGGHGVVKSAERALAILELLSGGRRRLSEVAEQLGLPLSSVHGLLATLVSRGFAEFEPGDRTYSLGLKAWTVGQGYEGYREIVGLALPLMRQLARDTGETVQLSRLDGIDNVYIAIAESLQPMKLVSAVGMRLPAYAIGLGKALLSTLSDEQLEFRFSGVELQRFTPRTVSDVPTLLAELRRARERGYGTDDEEYIIGCRCVAVPILDHSGAAVSAMSVSAPTPRCGPDWLEHTRDALSTAVDALEDRLRR